MNIKLSSSGDSSTIKIEVGNVTPREMIPPTKIEGSLNRLDTILESNHQPAARYNHPVMPDADPMAIDSIDLGTCTVSSPHNENKKMPSLTDSNGKELKTQASQNFAVESKTLRFFKTINMLCLSFYFLSCFIGLLIIVVLHFLNRLDQQKLLGVANVIIDYKFRTPSFEDIIILNANQSCPQDYNTISLGEWSGVTPGVFCPGDNSTLNPAQFSSIATRANCSGLISVGGIARFNITIFRGRRLCGRNSTKEAKYPTFNCNSTQKECYPGGCFPKESACPVTNISKNFWENNTNNPAKITKNDPGQAPIIDFRLVWGNSSVCLDDNRLMLLSNIKIYPLTPFSTDCGAFKNDAFFTDLGQANELDTLKASEVWKDIQYLPLFSNYSRSVSLRLIAIRREIISNKSECQNINLDDYKRAKSYLGKIDWNMAGYPLIAISCLAVLILISIYSGPTLLKAADDFNKGFNLEENIRIDDDKEFKRKSTQIPDNTIQLETPAKASQPQSLTFFKDELPSLEKQKSVVSDAPKPAKRFSRKNILKLFDVNWSEDWKLLLIANLLMFAVTSCLLVLYITTLQNWYNLNRLQKKFDQIVDAQCFQNEGMNQVFAIIGDINSKYVAPIRRYSWILFFISSVPHLYYFLFTVFKMFKISKKFSFK